MRKTRGFAFIAVVSMLVVLAVLITAYFVLTNIEVSSTKSIADGTTGYYAAEAGLNLRAEAVRTKFVQYNIPAGTAPGTTNPCVGGNNGTGDFACTSYSIKGRTVNTYIRPVGPPEYKAVNIPPGEAFENLTGQQFSYNLISEARTGSKLEASLAMRIRIVAIPMFQFMAFYAGDLEINPGPPMSMNGPIHTNGSLFLSSINGLQINGQVTYLTSINHGRKPAGAGTETTTCLPNQVSIRNAADVLTTLQPGTISACAPTPASNVAAYGGKVQPLITPLLIPPASSIAISPDSAYWTNADLRIALHLPAAGTPTAGNTTIEVLQKDLVGGVPVVDVAATAALAGCGAIPGTANVDFPATAAPAASFTLATTGALVNKFNNVREGTAIHMLNIDVRRLLQCINGSAAFGFQLNDGTNGGVVVFATVLGPAQGGQNNYGVRLTNANVLAPITPTGPTSVLKGLTFVSNQAVYVRGNYNCSWGAGSAPATGCTNTNPGTGVPSAWKPSAILSDSLNVLSNTWADTPAAVAGPFGRGPLANTVLAGYSKRTYINAAFLAGVDQTGATTGYNGGLQNYPRFHEDWDNNSAILTYRGSFVSLGQPLHVDGPFGNQTYNPPTREWDYETAFNDPVNLPPMTPWAVFLQQEQFVRQFEQ